MKKHYSGCWRYNQRLFILHSRNNLWYNLPSGVSPYTDNYQLITELLYDADKPWAYKDINYIAGDQIDVRTMLDESSDLLTSKTHQTCFVDTEIEPTFSVSCAHVSRTAVDTQGVASGTWNPDCSHTAAMVELEMDNLTSE